jgi:hypothetical protein
MPIITAKKRADFYSSERGQQAWTALERMVQNEAYKTPTSYSADALRYPDHDIPFLDKHMDYLLIHSATDVEQYVGNLRLMNRVN